MQAGYQLGGAKVVVPRDAVRVIVKLPPKYGADKFFVTFENGVKAMFEEATYWRFEVGDYLVVPDLSGDWVNVADRFEVYSVPFPSQERSFDLGYVSKPRRIGNGWLYMANLGEEGWLHISYSLAAAYFAHGMGCPVAGSYYQMLGIGSDVGQSDIKKAYRAMMRRYHPDVYRGPNAHLLAQRINEAYDTLSDPETRRQYDNMGRSSGDSEVKRWPGNGFGRLDAIVEKRGETWVVRRVLGFKRQERRWRFVVPKEDIHRRRIYVRALSRYVTVESVPDGVISAAVTLVEIARGGWSFGRRETWVRWEEKSIEVEWEVV